MATRTQRRHRIGGLVAAGVGLVVGGGGAAVATLGAHAEESIQEYQVDATLDGDVLSVVETIDYDFGTNQRHGIIREVDLGILDTGERVQLDDPTAATETADPGLEVSDDGLSTATLRVGDPDREYRGMHRYQLGYDLVGVPDPQESGQFTFIGIGDRWQVPIHDITIRVATDFEPGNANCNVGVLGGFDSCDAEVQDGVVTATVDQVDPGEGVILQLDAGAPASPVELSPPSLELDKESKPWASRAAAVGGTAGLAGLAGALLTSRWVKRAGADRTASLQNPTEAAFAEPNPYVKNDASGQPISDDAAAEQVTIQFGPPDGLTPAHGAVLEREQVDDAAKTAWLAQTVIDGWVDLTGDKDKPTLSRAGRSKQDGAHMPEPLAAALDGRDEIELGKYDEHFAAGWKDIGDELSHWRKSSGLWDHDRQKRNTAIAGALLLGGLLAVVVVGVALWLGLGRNLLLAVPLSAVAGLLFGAGIRGVAGGQTLAVRTPAGYGLWLRTEGFRRFLHESEGEHARWAADNGLLREYSAWAVALGELDRWNGAAAAAGIPPSDPGLMTTAAFVGLSLHAHSTYAAPSSSGGGGGGFSGGGFSGGVGGGGGGSW